MEYKYKVFISYRREDAVLKDTVYNILSEYIDEDRIFVDNKYLYNEPNEWAQSLKDALNTSEYIVICINKFTFVREPKDGKTDWYYEEIETALERQKAEGKIRVIPAINVRPDFDNTQFKELSILQNVAYLSLGQDGFRKNLLKMVGIDAIKYSQSIHTIDDNKESTNYINENSPIYITYARNDKSNPEWEHISDIKDIIVKKFKGNNIDVFDDDGDLKGGDNITDFENEIGDSEFTILIFSDKYFHSHHCMYELVQVMKAYNNGKKKKLVCIKSGNCNLKDDKLRQYWADYGGKRFTEELMGNKLTDIQQAAKNNGYYVEYIKDLYPFFIFFKYIDVNDLNVEGLINDFKIKIEEDYYLYIDDHKS